jgi:hypothetical protein
VLAAQQDEEDSEFEIVTEKMVLPFMRTRRAYAAAFIKETDGSRESESPSGASLKEEVSEETEGFGLLAEKVVLETGGSTEPFNPERAELGTDGGSCQK